MSTPIGMLCIVEVAAKKFAGLLWRLDFLPYHVPHPNQLS
jgi:hypothetical protein